MLKFFSEGLHADGRVSHKFRVVNASTLELAPSYCPSLHQLEEHGVRVGLELIADKRVADHVLFQPPLLRVHQLIYLCLVSYQLALAFEEHCDVVSEEVVAHDEGLVPLRTLLSRVAETV